MADVTAPPGAPQSVPALLARNAVQFGSKPAYREKRIRHLAELDLGGNRRGDRGHRHGPACAGRGARRPRGCHRTQPPRALLVDGRGAKGGRGSRAALPGRGGRGDGLRAGTLRRALRDRGRSGAGRQGHRGAGAPSPDRAHHLPGPAGPEEIRPHETAFAGDHTGRGARRPRAVRKGTRRARGGAGLRQYLRDALHQRDHRQIEGRGPVEPQHHRGVESLERVRPPARKRRGARLSADGLGGRFHLLDRSGLLDRVLRELPGKPGHDVREPARDRAHLFLCPAALFRGADHHPDDPDGGCQAAQAQHVSLLHGSPPARSAPS